jgi:hypothetical protein
MIINVSSGITVSFIDFGFIIVLGVVVLLMKGVGKWQLLLLLLLLHRDCDWHWG